MDAYHERNTTGECPEFFYKNGKKPITESYTNSDGTKVEMIINATNGGKLTKTQLKQIQNGANQKTKKESIREAMLLRLEQRTLQKQ